MQKLFIFFALVCLSFIHRQITWVAIGDSITYINDHLDETGNRITKGYMTRVVEKLPYIQYYNQGYNGWTSGSIAAHIDDLGIQKADIYSVFLGTNDCWTDRPIGKMSDYQNNTGNTTIYGSFRIIINKLRSLNNKASIILITPMQRTDFVYLKNMDNNAHGSYKPKDGQTLEQVAGAIKDIGLYEHFTVIDLYHDKSMDLKQLVKFKLLKDRATGSYKKYHYPGYLNIPFNPATDEYPYPVAAEGITYDGLHPSNKGNKIIADRLIAIMKKYSNGF